LPNATAAITADPAGSFLTPLYHWTVSKRPQKPAKAYGVGYHRGHLVPANHLDGSEETIKASNTMTNILPQTADLNLGAWLQTEEIIECYRDL
jgi:DNA/RNA endonuclease G (NUC1)